MINTRKVVVIVLVAVLGAAPIPITAALARFGHVW
jgi:hypothetical protein